MTFNQQKAIEDYTELARRISVGAYDERDHDGNYGADGVEESIDNLTELAAKHGLEFVYDEASGTWCLSPMSEETRIARYNAAIDARNRATVENRAKPWLPIQPGEEF